MSMFEQRPCLKGAEEIAAGGVWVVRPRHQKDCDNAITYIHWLEAERKRLVKLSGQLKDDLQTSQAVVEDTNRNIRNQTKQLEQAHAQVANLNRVKQELETAQERVLSLERQVAVLESVVNKDADIIRNLEARYETKMAELQSQLDLQSGEAEQHKSKHEGYYAVLREINNIAESHLRP